MCWWDLTGQGFAELSDLEIDAEITADFNPQDLSNLLIADVLKFGWKWSLRYVTDIHNDGNIIDFLALLGASFYELFTGGISKELNGLKGKLKNFYLDKIPTCVKSDGKCKNEGQL